MGLMETDSFCLGEMPFLSFQGEGINVGKPIVFVRFFGCNLDCAWCDTKQNEPLHIPRQKVFNEIRKLKIKAVEFTGGEPSLYMRDIFSIISELGYDYSYSIQTNGTRGYFEGIGFWTVSPKLPSAIGGEHSADYVSSILFDFKEPALKNNLEIKFVIGSHEDVLCAKKALSRADYVSKMFVPVIIQPVTKLTKLQQTPFLDCVDISAKLVKDLSVLGYNMKLIPQVHKFLGVQ